MSSHTGPTRPSARSASAAGTANHESLSFYRSPPLQAVTSPSSAAGYPRGCRDSGTYGSAPKSSTPDSEGLDGRPPQTSTTDLHYLLSVSLYDITSFKVAPTRSSRSGSCTLCSIFQEQCRENSSDSVLKHNEQFKKGPSFGILLPLSQWLNKHTTHYKQKKER